MPTLECPATLRCRSCAHPILVGTYVYNKSDLAVPDIFEQACRTVVFIRHGWDVRVEVVIQITHQQYW